MEGKGPKFVETRFFLTPFHAGSPKYMLFVYFLFVYYFG